MTTKPNTEQKFALEKWTVERNWRGRTDDIPMIVDTQGRIVADVYGQGIGVEIVESREANARLIAAAPLQHEALKAVLAHFDAKEE